MSRRREKPFPPWQSPAKDGIEKSFVRLGHEFLHDEEVERLPANAFRLFVYMLDEARGKKQFIFPESHYKDVMDGKAFRRARRELEKAGLIRTVSHNANTRKPAQYEFCNKWK